MSSKEIKRRLSRLEKLMLPAPEWEITAEFSDGHIENHIDIIFI